MFQLFSMPREIFKLERKKIQEGSLFLQETIEDEVINNEKTFF